MEKKVYLAECPLQKEKKEVSLEFVNYRSGNYFVIRNYDRMKPFLMSVVSDSDHWMYISSTGGLTAGRVNPEHALFPYYTDDKITESSEITGSKTIILLKSDDSFILWEPFSQKYDGVYSVQRNLYKNKPGNKIMFEEINHDLGLCFRYQWMNSDRFGWIRESSIENRSGEQVEVRMLDGVMNIMPWGIKKGQQEQYSTLMDAYKKSELLERERLALYRMSSVPVDRAEPSEALKVTTVWTTIPEPGRILISADQMEEFRLGRELSPEKNIKAKKGAFFTENFLKLNPGSESSWMLVMNTAVGHTGLAELRQQLADRSGIQSALLEDINRGSRNLADLVEDADGIQETADLRLTSRHFSNVLFNIMRGGIYAEGYTISREDFRIHLKRFNREMAGKYSKLVDDLPPQTDYRLLESKISETGDLNLIRIFFEYLPLTFSRRHGDPSRPWNLFSIDLKNQDGSRKLAYQGNWRDIFQNWEALSFSYPHYIQAIISKFLNASTADGYNPYRITQNGIDWEIHDPSDPWSFIGYWGDHQIIYLVKLMELSEKFFPGRLSGYFDSNQFSYALVPYRIKEYQEILLNPYRTIDFDEELNSVLEKNFSAKGADGKLLPDASGAPVMVNMIEKLLLTFMVKMSNFIPGAGIWMNTQRPEWNDANNALVGSGASMVTLYYMRRYCNFVCQLVEKDLQRKDYSISADVNSFLNALQDALSGHRAALEGGIGDRDRKKILDSFGKAGSDYRKKIYRDFSTVKKTVTKQEIITFFSISLEYIDQSIESNRRKDGLFHAYNLISIAGDEIRIRRLYEMLEGQVALLSSGFLTPEGSLELLENLKNSRLYRSDQDSYILYPNRELPEFTEINKPSAEKLMAVELVPIMLKKGDLSVLSRDINGDFHFNSDFNNAHRLHEKLLELRSKKQYEISDREISDLLGIYEETFDHQSFTGRSGSFYKYEGLGSIYWHMVSKLVLAIAELISQTGEQEKHLKNALIAHYRKVKEGIGVHKNPADYGAFPTDPYSHTPSMAGVQQPGMTGQVKEDILSRFLELGIRIVEGCLRIEPGMMERKEFRKSVQMKNPLLSFSFCRVKFEYELVEGKPEISVFVKNGENSVFEGLSLNAGWTGRIISRNGDIEKVLVRIPDDLIQ